MPTKPPKAKPSIRSCTKIGQARIVSRGINNARKASAIGRFGKGTDLEEDGGVKERHGGGRSLRAKVEIEKLRLCVNEGVCLSAPIHTKP